MYSYTHAYGCSEEEARELIAAYREFYGVDALLHVDPYDGIYDLCQGVIDLGLKAAVATNKAQVYADRILQHFGFDKYMTVIHGADMKSKLGKPDLIKLAAKDCGADLPECVMVGDTEFDAKGAEEAGVPFLAVTYGFANMDEMLKYPNIGTADSPAEVLDMIRKMAE
jgi:phosphoglycolate phosphatase